MSEGETFDASIDNIEKRTVAHTLPGGLQLAMLPKKTKGGAVQRADEPALRQRKGSGGARRRGRSRAADADAGNEEALLPALKDEFDSLKAEVRSPAAEVATRPTPGGSRCSSRPCARTCPRCCIWSPKSCASPPSPEAEFETLRKETLAQLEEQLQIRCANGFNTLLRNMIPAAKDRRPLQPATERKDREDQAPAGRRGRTPAQDPVGHQRRPDGHRGRLRRQGHPASWKKSWAPGNRPRPTRGSNQPFKAGSTEKSLINTPGQTDGGGRGRPSHRECATTIADYPRWCWSTTSSAAAPARAC